MPECQMSIFSAGKQISCESKILIYDLSSILWLNDDCRKDIIWHKGKKWQNLYFF